MKVFAVLLVAFSLAGCGSSRNNSSANNQSASNDKDGSHNKSTATRELDPRAADINKMRQIALAIHNFHDPIYCFPWVARSVNKQVMSDQLSWRIRVLPFVEMANLADKFELKQPWDSQQNKPLIDAGKDVFTLSNGNLICAIKHEDEARSLDQIVDGTSQTIMLLEHPKVDGEKWTQPIDITEKEAVKLIQSLKKGEFLIAINYDVSSTKVYSPAGKGLRDEEIAAPFGIRDGVHLNKALFQK